MNLLIKVGSITNAQRGARVLSSKGYKSRINKLSPDKSDKGCGWAIVTESEDEKPVKILEGVGIRVRGAEHL